MEKKQYLTEFRTHWRSLASASLGLAAGYSLVAYTNNLFTPLLLDEFGWTRADIARIGTTAFLGILTQPIAGRLTDAFGVRPVALTGVILAPLMFVGLSAMTGPLWQFLALIVLQLVIVGGTTSPVVYSRLVAQNFHRARGMALAIAASAAPIAGAACIPILSLVIDQHGWRGGYLALAAVISVGGALAIGLIPKSRTPPPLASGTISPHSSRYRDIISRRAFQLIVPGIVLCNLSFVLQTVHLKVVLLDSGVDSNTGSSLISVFALSVVAGRLLCGIALDRFPAHVVTSSVLALPGLGLGMLAMGVVETPAVAVAVSLLGFSLGAEGDAFAYLVRRYFPMEVFGTVLGLVFSGMAFAVAGGSLLLSVTLDLSGGYPMFLGLTSIAAFVGCGLFLMLGREPTFG